MREFWLFLRANGIDARLDLPAAERRQDWVQWMTRQVGDADRILVVAPPEPHRWAEGDAAPDEGQGVQFEARLIRDRFYANQEAGPQLVLPVVLPGGSADGLPLWLTSASTTHYAVRDYTAAGAEALLRVLTGQPREIEPELGPPPYLPPRGVVPVAGVTRPVLRTQVLIEASVAAGGLVDSAVWLGGSLLCQRQAPLPAEVASVWGALQLPALAAAERMADAGRRLAGVLFDEAAQRTLAAVVEQLPVCDTVEVVLSAAAPLLSLPVELIRLATEAGDEMGPLGLATGVSVCRRSAPAEGGRPGPVEALATRVGLPGPLKILAAVAAPDETKTGNVPLDAEAEMQAVLDAVTDVAGGPAAQVRILEVASLAQIRQALERDVFHVLHLSAHGSPESVELEDEDGNPVPVTAADLMGALRQAGRPVPLIVLSSCSGGSASHAMASGLAGRGADRVIAMLAPVTDGYATVLARRLYQELARPGSTAGQALARARCLAEEDRSHHEKDQLPLPEYGVATLLATGGDGPLIDPGAPAMPLMTWTAPVSGRPVRELPVGMLIGRRTELRMATGVLRRTPEAVREFGAASGVALTGIGGIGKTALAGRIISRLRQDGWLVAVHEGRWNPTALIAATADAVVEAASGVTDPALAAALGRAGEVLTDPGGDDGPKLAAVAGLLAGCRLLVVFDDFEQNLTTGGLEFLDPAVSEVMTVLANAAQAGALLITCRYRLPGPDLFLAEVPVPALSPAELRRMFLRLPALAELDPADRRLLTRTIGGHPRLIEFTDALLRGGRSGLRHIQTRLRDLAHDHHIDLRGDRPVAQAIDQAMILGSADILLTELLNLLTARQAAVLAQVAVCRAPMTLEDLAFTFSPGLEPAQTDLAAAESPLALAELRADTTRLADLTLLEPGSEIAMHPWTAALASRHTAADPAALHRRALAMRLRRFEQQRGSYDDLLEIPRHLAALHRYDDIAEIAGRAARMLPNTLATVAYLSEVRPLIPQAERAWILVAELEVQALLSAGNLTAATRELEAIHQQAETRAAANPANTQWQRDLSISRNRLGDVAAAAGDLGAARGHYQAALDIAERLAAADPANAEWQRDLSVSRNRLGDVAAAAGDQIAARGHYQAALDIRVTLAAADRANAEWQRDLSVSRNRLGDVAAAAGDLGAARGHYQAALDIAERLAAADPANAEWQRDLSISRNKLGDVAAAAGNQIAARGHYQAALDIAERLAAADPANTEWQRDLSISRNKLGDVAAAAGNQIAARDYHQAALDIAERLAAADPANTQWQRDLSVSRNRLGDVAAAAGDLGAARGHYQAALDIAERLAAADPANAEWQRDLSVSRNRLGDVAAAAGDLGAGVTFVADDLAGWLVGLLADASRMKLTTLVLGSDQEGALLHAATAAVRDTAADVSPSDSEQAERLAIVINQVFSEPMPVAPLAGAVTLREGLRAGIAHQLAVLDDVSLTGTGKSSADTLRMPRAALADRLASHLTREITLSGSRGGPLMPLANQLNYDQAHLQGQRSEGFLTRLLDEVHASEQANSAIVPLRVFISYAHDDAVHVERVREFWLFLRANGIDARLDLHASEQRQDWANWIAREVRDADRVLVVASPEYRRRAEGDAGPSEGRGVQWESRLIRDRFYADLQAGLKWSIPVVLPGCSASDIPLWLMPASTTHYVVSDYTVAGAESLLRVLTRQPQEVEPQLGVVPRLPSHGGEPATVDMVKWDFFVSYAQVDQAWAKWVAWQLEEDGHRVLIQAWDFAPGSNWILNMHEGVQRAARTIAILSSAYLSSVYATAEWQAAWARDPGGEIRKLIAVRVSDCEKPRLLSTVVGCDLFGASEPEACSRLRSAIAVSLRGRNRSVQPSSFPPPQRQLNDRVFPGVLPKIWNVPARDPNFTGRLGVLARIRATWTEEGRAAVQVLQGLGGIGKTMTAVEYAHRNAADYDVVWWINAENPHLLAGQFADLAGPLGLEFEASTVDKAQAVNAELRRRTRWLIIYDNAAAAEDIGAIFLDGPGHVLITTREDGFSSIGTVTNLDVLGRQESIEFLHGRIAYFDAVQANQLANRLSDFPLALAQAAAYINDSGISLAEYLRLLDARAGDFRILGLAADPDSVAATTWSVTFDVIRAQQPAALELLELSAWLALEPIPVDLFSDYPDRLPEHLAIAGRDPLALAETVQVLVALGLARRTTNGFVLHRCVRDTILRSLDPVSNQFTIIIALLRACLPQRIIGAPEGWARWRQLLPHVLAATSRFDGGATAGDVAWLMEGAVAYITVVNGRPADGLPLLVPALAIHEQAYGSAHPQAAADLNGLAQVLTSIGHHQSATSLLEQSLRSLGAADDLGHPDLAGTLRALASASERPSDTKPPGNLERYPDSQGDTRYIKPLGSRHRQVYILSDVFKKNGVPTVTFVEPPDFARFRAALRTPGRGIVVEGPSGIGKTTLLRKALSEGYHGEQRLQVLSGRARRDRTLIEQLPSGHDGVVAVDDFHRLPQDIRLALVDYLKILADEESDNRLILIGIPDTGRDLVDLGFDVVTRVDVFRLPPADDELVLRMVRQGETALNIRFSHPDEIVSAAAGSLLVAQMLCWELAVLAGVDATQDGPKTVTTAVGQAIEQAVQSCRTKYEPVLAKFAMLDGPKDTICLTLLAELASSADGIISLNELRTRRRDLQGGIEAFLAKSGDSFSGLLNRIGQHLLYEPSTGRLLAEDPQLMFYLRHKPIEQLAAALGKNLPQARDQIFVSYSHRDKEWLQRLEIHLRPLVRDRRVDLWADTRIAPGDRWRDEIAMAIGRAKAAVLLVSADFLASDFIDKNELPPLLKKAEERGCVILPVIVAPSLFSQSPTLSAFQAVNDPAIPLSAMSKHEQEQTLQHVAMVLLSLIK